MEEAVLGAPFSPEWLRDSVSVERFVVIPEKTPPPAPDLEMTDSADTEGAGQRIDEGNGRVFPCDGCGADLKFHIGEQSLSCPYCGHVKEIDLSDDGAIVEKDYHSTLAEAAEDLDVRQYSTTRRQTLQSSHLLLATCRAC